MSESTTVASLLAEGEELFKTSSIHHGHGLYDAWDEAVYLLSHALNLNLSLDRSMLPNLLSKEEVAEVRRLFRERSNEKTPSAYLTSCAWFCGLPFYVDRRVLIPRSPIGNLIKEKFQPWVPVQPNSILDLCTGSGCIGISCAYAFPSSNITISDISEDALIVASKNVNSHKCSGQIQICESDLFDDLGDERYDLIVSNPPYVDLEDYRSMPGEYFAEPALGLIAGDDGLDIVRRILCEAVDYLHEGGSLIVEVGNSAAALEQTYPDLPFLWVDFSEGDAGVFILTREQLIENHNFLQIKAL
ncbi:MAG: 50S ribosomal protein L3 N(5)-glutamine methyltransferase [Porticoccaceae bacterium]|nr:50S ribosomal protein L3 N(5)-glutamine methyltransferase [Porticoccaceae bacterium]|tara:strand:- start:718 stop:1623 length:906 start_codon:yes stop_codon:yes gene_type:complete